MAEEKNDAAAAQEKDQAVATQPPCRCAAREEHPLKVPYAPEREEKRRGGSTIKREQISFLFSPHRHMGQISNFHCGDNFH